MTAIGEQMLEDMEKWQKFIVKLQYWHWGGQPCEAPYEVPTGDFAEIQRENLIRLSMNKQDELR